MKLLLSTLAIATMLVMPLAIVAAPRDGDPDLSPEKSLKYKPVKNEYGSPVVSDDDYEGNDVCHYNEDICWKDYSCRKPDGSAVKEGESGTCVGSDL